MVRHPGRRAPSVPLKCNGTGGRTRTGTLFRAGDFESPVSTNFTTPAQGGAGARAAHSASARLYQGALAAQYFSLTLPPIACKIRASALIVRVKHPRFG